MSAAGRFQLATVLLSLKEEKKLQNSSWVGCIFALVEKATCVKERASRGAVA